MWAMAQQILPRPKPVQQILTRLATKARSAPSNEMSWGKREGCPFVWHH